MLPTRFIWRLYAGYILLILVAALTAGFFVSRQVERNSRAEIVDTLLAQTYLLRELAMPAFLGKGAGLQASITELGRQTRTRFTVIAAEGRVLADSEEDPTGMDLHHTRPEVLQARDQGLGRATRFSQTLRVEMLYLAIPAYRGDEIVGYLRAALPLDSVENRLGEIRRMILLGAVLASLLALVIGLVLARRSTDPLRAMTRAARQIAGGQGQGRVPESRGSLEIRELAASFNSMADQLQDRIEAATAERNQLAAILAGMNEGVLAVDAEERIVHVNGLGAELLRLGPHENRGRYLWESSRVAEASELVSEALEENRFLRREITLVDGDRQRIIELKASPLPREEDRPSGAVLVLNEVTELRQLESMRRDFIANASHELKTPLTAVRGLAETLLEDPNMDPETQQRFIDKLNRQVRRLSELLSDLLSLSRLESQDAQFRLEELDLAELAERCAADQQALAEARGLTLRSQPSGAALPVLADRSALRQVLDNLLDNAIKYTSTGGQVTLRFGAAGGQAILEVEDDGPGIEPEHQTRIFERFYRVDKARSRELGGTGLGLAIVKHIVLNHGGDVSVESEPGRGSRFRVRIPLLSN